MSEERTEQTTPPENEAESSSFKVFLESTPPSAQIEVLDLLELKSSSGSTYYSLNVPDLELHCEECEGLRVFRYREGNRTFSKDVHETYLKYLCGNCRSRQKIFSLHISSPSDNGEGFAYKFGEYPPYGAPTPPRLLRMFASERETFLKGRRSENMGLGVGAFAYYRRVVEHQKTHILEEIIKVSRKLNAPPEMIATLERAQKEGQFSKALESVKDAVPQALLINGHNPLTLLHSALSEGLHEQTDEECLELAHTIRVILVELVERIGQALKDHAELNSAVTRLLQPKAPK
jgi:hypothetical protein